MFECHVTINPVYGNDLEVVRIIAESHNFKVANLLMQRRKEDTPERSKNDTFMTGHAKDYSTMKERMLNIVNNLQSHGYKVWRYKIEEIVIDSKYDDCFNLINL